MIPSRPRNIKVYLRMEMLRQFGMLTLGDIRYKSNLLSPHSHSIIKPGQPVLAPTSIMADTGQNSHFSADVEVISLLWLEVTIANGWALSTTVKYLVSAPPPSPRKHKFLRKVGGGRLLGILPFVQSIIQPLKVQVNTKRLEFKQKSYLFPF